MCFGCSKEPSHWDGFLLSTHNICFGWEIEKIVFQYALLSKGPLEGIRLYFTFSISWACSCPWIHYCMPIFTQNEVCDIRGSQIGCLSCACCQKVKLLNILKRKFSFFLWGKTCWLLGSFVLFSSWKWGAQWLSGFVLDSRLKGRGFEPHWRHCVMSLSKNINPSLVLVQPRKTRLYITERLLMGRKESNQTNFLKSIC